MALDLLEAEMYPNDWNEFSKFIHLSKYSRWNDAEGRREDWAETVDRWWVWLCEQARQNGLGVLDLSIRDMVYQRDVMPSMRSLMTAGPAADRGEPVGPAAVRRGPGVPRRAGF